MMLVPTIGLETHVQLKTASKMFCGCATSFGAPPNTQVCPVCLGYPGAMPSMNREAVRLTVVSGLMLGCDIATTSAFDRKSYFYPDMPKNYQISQYDRPLCLGGGVDIEAAGATRRIALTRIHLEEDVAKSMHFRDRSGVDFNRAGVPLMEIVSEPDLTSPEEALAYLIALKQLLLYAAVTEGNLEEGNMRCDVNVSVRPAEREAFGVKVELKNLNTFKGVLNALRYEVDRQSALLHAGETVVQETRRWDAELGRTFSMRIKEDAHDYRYFPEPDLMPVQLDPATVAAWRAALPETPARRRERFVGEYGLPAYDAGVLAADRQVGDYFEEVARRSGNPKAASNWIMTDMLRLLSEREMDIARVRVTAAALAELIGLVDARVLNSNSARQVFEVLFEQGGSPAAIVEARGLIQVSDTAAIDAMVDQAMAAHPGPVADYRAGKTQALKFLVGQVMRLSRGKANPNLAEDALLQKLTSDLRPPTSDL